MIVVNKNTVVISSSEELKKVLEEENAYNYIIFGNNIALEQGILINNNKTEITIDGTYSNVRYNCTINNSNTISARSSNKKIVIKNLDIVSCNIYGMVSGSTSSSYSDVVIEYNNVKFNGVQFGYNPCGILRIMNCNVTIENNNGIEAQEVAEAGKVEVGGNNTINSNSTRFALFYYSLEATNPSLKFLANSTTSLRANNSAFMQGTSNLDLQILHDAIVNLSTKSGFSSTDNNGAFNVLIDKRATFTFIENNHYKVPMWRIYGTLTVNENANLLVINTYDSTPIDNYNIYFKGKNNKMILNNPNNIIIYTKNANILYTDNPMEFSIKASRINMWIDSFPSSSAGSITDIPDYYWYKSDQLVEISGIINNTSTVINNSNLSTEELKKLSSLDNFLFQSRKQFSIGCSNMNIHPINNNSTSISGNTLAHSDVLIKYNNVEKVVTADADGIFVYTLPNSISDNTEIEITSCVATSFIYETRIITTPHDGELTLLEAPNIITFSLIPLSFDPTILPKTKEHNTKIVDSRVNSSIWKLLVRISGPMTSENGFELIDSIIFKKFDNEIVVLKETPSVVFTGNTNDGNVETYDITWSTEKGLMLSLENSALEINEEYSTDVIWSVEE